MDMEPIPDDEVKVPPTFKVGDINSFYKWVSENLTYPEDVQGIITLFRNRF